MTDQTRISHGRRRISGIPSSHISSFPGKVHFNIKYQVSCNILLTNWIMIVPVQKIEINPRFLHIFSNGVMPQCFFIFKTKLQGILNYQGNFYPKLEYILSTPLFDCLHKPVTFISQFMHPPSKIGFIGVTVGHSMLCHINWVLFLYQMYGKPISSLIYSF